MSHSGFRKYFANTSWLFAGKFFQMGIAFFVGVWVARYLGPEKFGLLSFARSFVGLFMAISTLGLDGIVVRELVKNETKKDILLGTSFVLKLIGAVIAIVLVSMAICFTSTDNLTRIMVLLIATSLIFQSFNVIDLYFQSKVVSKFSVLVQMTSAALSALVKIFLIVSRVSVIYFAAMAVFDMATIGAGYLYFYKKYTNETLTKWKFDVNCAKSLLKESYPLILSFFATTIALQSTSIILKGLLDNQSVGYYSAAQRVIGLFFFLPVLFTQSFFPSLINSNNEKYYKKAISISSLLVFLAIIVFLLLLVPSKYIILNLYGLKYHKSIALLQILSFSVIFIFFASVRKKLLLIEKQTKLISYYSIFTGMIMILASYVFIKLYGVNGAAIGYSFTWAFSILILPFFFNRPNEIKLFLLSFNPKNIIEFKRNE